MYKVLEFLERIAAGPIPDPFDMPVLDFGKGNVLTERMLINGVLVLGSIGKGKTTLGKTLLEGMLRHGFGGLVTTVKVSQIGEIQDTMRKVGRERDLIVFAPKAGHVFNPLETVTDVTEATELLVSLAALDASAPKGADENFWRKQTQLLVRNLLTICHEFYGRYDFVSAAKLFADRANSIAQVEDPNWRKNSVLAHALTRLVGQLENPEAQLAIEYFTKEYPSAGDKLQGSITACVSNVFDNFRRPPLSELFSGKSNLSMHDLLSGGKILVVGIPILDAPATGSFANGVMQFCFCREAKRNKRETNSFLFSDECQETITPELMRDFLVLREHRVAPILLTQNVAAVDNKIGENARDSLFSELGTKIFCAQNHAKTRQWASDVIDKNRYKKESISRGETTGKHGGGISKSTSEQEEWEYVVHPSRFIGLEVGETICFRDGHVWKSRWHKDNPGKSGTVKVV